ncbi:MAG: Asp23/Gls24 family envelope stress response protein [Oscillospiraceae bacterium]|nr:Asp23/Gls24 family envelope stress response protein [Oscillospiraceae bacterium]
MENNKTELSVNTQVLEKMAEIAAKEIEGVSGICKKAVDIKGAVKTKSAFKGVVAENVNGAIKITVYITVKSDAKVREVAEAVQKNVKDKIQTMTGTAVTTVKVVAADIDFEETASEE